MISTQHLTEEIRPAATRQRLARIIGLDTHDVTTQELNA